jgi:TIR domain
VFLCYSHQDTRWKDRLLSHLRVWERQNKFAIWDASDIQTGADWSQQIISAVEAADVAVLLI